MKTLRTAIKAATTDRNLDRALNQLHGCPIGAWGETDQAMRAIVAELPIAALRRYHVITLINALFTIDAAERYRRKA